ncbi:MAG TPA: hypothetical protein DCL21_01590 [Alphaproteobacteria bacterium]|nr:hypothetical protein [Alphaproteobacteria bacterium]
MKSIYKTIFIIATLILLSDNCLAEEKELIEVVATPFIVASKVLLGIIALGLGVILGFLGIIIGCTILLTADAYYYSKDVVLSNTQERMVETKLCPAALELYIDFDSAEMPASYYAEEFNELNYKKISKIEPFIKPWYKQNKKPNFLCIGCNNPNATLAAGKWYPLKAFNYDGFSYLQLAKPLDDGEYITATTAFNRAMPYLKYNNHNIFKDNRLTHFNNVRDLCPILRRISIHKLKNKEA